MRASKGSPLRWLAVAVAVLAGVALVMRFVRPAEKGEVYNPPPPPPKTVADLERQIKDVKTNKHIPESQKGRILGFLQMDLQKAKAAEGGSVTPPRNNRFGRFGVSTNQPCRPAAPLPSRCGRAVFFF